MTLQRAALGRPYAGALLSDRAETQAVLDSVLADAQGGESSVLVVHGDPGVGKTVLLDYAALQVLCAPILKFAKRLPGPQREALSPRISYQRLRAWSSLTG